MENENLICPSCQRKCVSQFAYNMHQLNHFNFDLRNKKEELPPLSELKKVAKFYDNDNMRKEIASEKVAGIRQYKEFVKQEDPGQNEVIALASVDGIRQNEKKLLERVFGICQNKEKISVSINKVSGVRQSKEKVPASGQKEEKIRAPVGIAFDVSQNEEKVLGTSQNENILIPKCSEINPYNDHSLDDRKTFKTSKLTGKKSSQKIEAESQSKVKNGRVLSLPETKTDAIKIKMELGTSQNENILNPKCSEINPFNSYYLNDRKASKLNGKKSWQKNKVSNRSKIKSGRVLSSSEIKTEQIKIKTEELEDADCLSSLFSPPILKKFDAYKKTIMVENSPIADFMPPLLSKEFNAGQCKRIVDHECYTVNDEKKHAKKTKLKPFVDNNQLSSLILIRVEDIPDHGITVPKLFDFATDSRSEPNSNMKVDEPDVEQPLGVYQGCLPQGSSLKQMEDSITAIEIP